MLEYVGILMPLLPHAAKTTSFAVKLPTIWGIHRAREGGKGGEVMYRRLQFRAAVRGR